MINITDVRVVGKIRQCFNVHMSQAFIDPQLNLKLISNLWGIVPLVHDIPMYACYVIEKLTYVL